MAASAGHDKVYYTLALKYDERCPCSELSAELQYSSDDSIVEHANDYYASVVSFSVPVSDIPIFIIDAKPFPNTNPNVTIYKVAVEYDGNIETRDVIYTPSNTSLVPPPAPTASDPKFRRTDYYYTYSYGHFINQINKAYRDAFDALPATPPGSEAPQLYFDPAALLFTLKCSLDYDSELPTPIYAYMGYELGQFFQGFDYITTGFRNADARDYRFHVVINSNVENNTILMTQDYPTAASWSCFRSLQLRSSMIPIEHEFTPSAGTDSNGKNNRTPVLASFTPLFSNQAGNAVARTAINYTLDSAYRLIDMNSDTPLKRFSLSIYWTDELFVEHKLKLNYRETVQVKLLFHKKSTFMG